MPEIIETVIKHLHIPIPVKRRYTSDLISLIDLSDITIRFPNDSPRPLITGSIMTEIRIPIGMSKLKFMTEGVQAKFYLLHPRDQSRKISLLQTEGWHECASDQNSETWKITAKVREAPVEIIDGEGFDDWIKMMLAVQGETMESWVEGSCSAGVKALGTKVKIKKIPIKAKLNIPGIRLSISR